MLEQSDTWVLWNPEGGLGSVVIVRGRLERQSELDWSIASGFQYFHAPKQWLSKWEVRRKGTEARDNNVKSSPAALVSLNG